MGPRQSVGRQRLGQHHLAVHLDERMPVLWVDPPISYLTRQDASAAAALRGTGCGPSRRHHVPEPVTVPGSPPVCGRWRCARSDEAVRRAVVALGANVRARSSPRSMTCSTWSRTRSGVLRDRRLRRGAALMGTDAACSSGWSNGSSPRQTS